MRNWKKILIAITIITVSGIAWGWYLYNEKPADVRKQRAYREMLAEELVREFEEDEGAANREYIDKVLLVSGTVGSVEIDSVGRAILSFETGDPLNSVTCSFYNSESGSVRAITPGMRVRVKGNCTGKLMDVILNKCSIVK